MIHILVMTSIIFVGINSRAEMKRIIINLDYKVVNSSESYKRPLQPSGKKAKAKDVKVYIPNEMIGVPAQQNDDVTCMTHTGSTLTVSPKLQTVRVDTTKGDAFSYLIVDEGTFNMKKQEVLSKYLLDDGRKVVTNFTLGATTGSGYFIRNSGEISPTFPCSKN